MDSDVDKMSIGDLMDEVLSLREAIRKHRDEKVMTDALWVVDRLGFNPGGL